MSPVDWINPFMFDAFQVREAAISDLYVHQERHRIVFTLLANGKVRDCGTH